MSYCLWQRNFCLLYRDLLVWGFKETIVENDVDDDNIVFVKYFFAKYKLILNL